MLSSLSLSMDTNTGFMSSALNPAGTLNLRDGLRNSLFESPSESTNGPFQCENTLPFSATAFQVTAWPDFHVFGVLTLPTPFTTSSSTIAKLASLTDFASNMRMLMFFDTFGVGAFGVHSTSLIYAISSCSVVLSNTIWR